MKQKCELEEILADSTGLLHRANHESVMPKRVCPAIITLGMKTEIQRVQYGKVLERVPSTERGEIARAMVLERKLYSQRPQWANAYLVGESESTYNNFANGNSELVETIPTVYLEI